MDIAPAHEVVADAFLGKSKEERAAYARQLVAYAIAALVIEVGPQAAQAEIYNIAKHIPAAAA